MLIFTPGVHLRVVCISRSPRVVPGRSSSLVDRSRFIMPKPKVARLSSCSMIYFNVRYCTRVIVEHIIEETKDDCLEDFLQNRTY